eukprot:SAG31_NODE_706_length_12688_cov_41.991342_14_plen_86_part_00
MTAATLKTAAKISVGAPVSAKFSFVFVPGMTIYFSLKLSGRGSCGSSLLAMHAVKRAPKHLNTILLQGWCDLFSAIASCRRLQLH